MIRNSIRFSVSLAIISGCATPAIGPAQPGSMDPLEVALVETGAELETYRANVLALESMSGIDAEIARHAEVRGPIYQALRERALVLDSCAAPIGPSLVGMVNGIEATDRGLEQALKGATSQTAAAHAFDGYGAGISELSDKLANRFGQMSCE